MRARFPVRSLFALGLTLGAAALVQATRTQAAAPEADPVLIPFLVEEVRTLGVVPVQAWIANPGAETSVIRPERLRVFAGGEPIADVALAGELQGDPRYGRANELIERLPDAHHGEERWFAPADAPMLAGDDALRAHFEIDALVDAMRADYAAGRPEPFAQVDFPLPTDQIFFRDDPPGTAREVSIVLDYRGADGKAAALSVARTIRRLPPPLETPDTLKGLGASVHAGDLHVHSCHGEAMGACAPSGNCTAESFQTSGSFTYAQLKSQYQALGLDWFTATDHSYCIDSAAEYSTVVAECAALTDGSFLVVPDIELSSDEEGAQVGSDVGDLACLGTTSANHMGAHGISAHKPGGDEGFLGFCDGLFGDALLPFTQNAAAVRAEGGYPIANHPLGSSFAWNSFAATQGIEAKSLHGVEIWNGATQIGQGGHVGRWVEWLLGGRLLYAYSGSDTHDAAFAFGANHALFQGEPFTVDGLEKVLKAGRVFVSNGHQLVLEVDHDGATLPMGTLQALAPAQPASPLTLRVHHNFGGSTSTITIFRGRVGDGAESVACTSPPLSGQGVFECGATLEPGARTWYRAHSESGSDVAYTNPVFFLPGSCSYVPYGTGLGAANIATLSSGSSPTLGSFNTLRVSGFAPSSLAAFYAISAQQIPGGSPLLGGFLLIGPPFFFIGVGPLSGGAGSFAFQVPPEASVGAAFFWQAAALDAGQPGGFAFSNGLAMTLCDVLQ